MESSQVEVNRVSWCSSDIFRLEYELALWPNLDFIGRGQGSWEQSKRKCKVHVVNEYRVGR